MNRPRKPLWSDGLALWPNHFEAQDEYHEQLLTRRLRALTAYDWGVIEVSLDEHALAAGQVSVTRLDAILPDGTPILVGETNGDLLPARSLDPRATPEHVDVFVGLARIEDGRPNVDGNDHEPTRYVRTDATSRDLATGKLSKSVPWLRHKLTLRFDHEDDARRDVLQIARLVRSASGAWIQEPTFVPPVLRIGASELLVGGMRRVLAALVAKQQAVSISRRQRHAAAIEFQARDAPRFWLLDALNTTIPLFVELVDKADSTSPKEAHLALAQLIGRLSTFRPDSDVTDIARFNVLAIGEVFGVMFERTLDLLRVVIAESYIEVPLVAHPNQYFTGQLSDPQLLRCDFFLAVSSATVPENEFRESLPHLFKMGSSRELGKMMNAAIQGVRLTLEHHPPGALPVKPGLAFFRIDNAGESWQALAASGSFSMWLPYDLIPSLYAVDSDTLQ